MRRRPVPRDVLTVMRLASGCRETAVAAAATTSRDPDFVVAAAELYLRQVVCFRGADPHRTLGVAANAPRAQMREHMRELVLWLHPDRSGTGWDAALMQRVLEAWQTLGGPESARPKPTRPAAATPQATRPRRSTTYRPTWISQPLPKKRRRRSLRTPSPMILRFAVLIMAMVVPEFAVLSPSSLADDLQRHEKAPSAPVSDPTSFLRTDSK